jgi:hypothetical protein
MVNPGRQPMFWTVDTTEMTRQQAEQASKLIRASFAEVYADPVDPKQWVSMRLDRWTAELLCDALICLHKAGGHIGDLDLLEDIEDWLANQAEPYPADVEAEDRYQPLN